MKNNTKGFTLIELLAVIVILAIIALIATPIVLNLIEKAKKGAAESSTYAYIKAVEQSAVVSLMDAQTAGTSATGFANLTCEVQETQTQLKCYAAGGNATDASAKTLNVDVKGDLPKATSKLTLNASSAVSGLTDFEMNGYAITFSDGKVSAGTASAGE